MVRTFYWLLWQEYGEWIGGCEDWKQEDVHSGVSLWRDAFLRSVTSARVHSAVRQLIKQKVYPREARKPKISSFLCLLLCVGVCGEAAFCLQSWPQHHETCSV